MNRVAKIFALSLFGLSLAAVGHSARLEQVTTLNCTGGYQSFSLPVYAYTLATSTASPQFFSVYTAFSGDDNQFEVLRLDMLFGFSLEGCRFASAPTLFLNSPAVEEMTIAASGIGVDVDVNANGSGGGASGTVKNAGTQYLAVIFSYNGITSESAAAKPKAVTAPLTPAEKRAALAAFKATLVPPKN